jgi:hypothetical protein
MSVWTPIEPTTSPSALTTGAPPTSTQMISPDFVRSFIS